MLLKVFFREKLFMVPFYAYAGLYYFVYLLLFCKLYLPVHVGGDNDHVLLNRQVLTVSPIGTKPSLHI